MSDERPISKHLQVMQRRRELMMKRDARLDALLERQDKFESTSDVVFRAYEGEMENEEALMKEMEEDTNEMRRNMLEVKGEQTAGNKVANFPDKKTVNDGT